MLLCYDTQHFTKSAVHTALKIVNVHESVNCVLIIILHLRRFTLVYRCVNNIY